MSELAKFQNVFRGIAISIVITTIAYILISVISIIVGFVIYSRFILFADLQFSLGSVFGIVYFMKNRRPYQSILQYGVIVGIVGGIGSAFVISIYQWILLFNFIYFIIYIINCLITGVFIGFLIGVLISVYYMYKEVKGKSHEKKQEDEFFKDLFEE